MSTRVNVYLSAALVPPDLADAIDGIGDHVVEILRQDHSGVRFALGIHVGPTHADFTVYEDTPDEQVAPGLDDIESEADQALADAIAYEREEQPRQP